MKDQFNQFMREKINGLNCSSELKTAIKYSLINNGKLIRPLIFLFYIDDAKKYFDIAMSIECIHTYSLVHDDLPALDNDDYRRGQLTTHKQFGEAMAILVGDSLLTLAFELITNNSYLTAEQKLRLINVLATYAGVNQGMINGQILDVFNLCTNQEQLDQMYVQKTGQLITASLLMANIIDPQNPDQLLINIGQELGLLYQIQDDYLDAYGSLSQIGKDIGSDQRNHKLTYASLYSQKELEQIITDHQRVLESLIKQSTFNDQLVALISSIYNRSN